LLKEKVMSTAATLPSHPVLADLIPGSRVRDVVLIVAGAALTGLAAQVSILTSLSPVPFTLQTLAALLVGASLGSARGMASMGLYALVGVLGVPWFAAHTSGFSSVSFGYIIGFILAAGLVGELAKRGADRHILGTVALMVFGNVLIYAVGTTWLAVNLHLGAGTAIGLGVRPFLISDALKIVVAAIALPGTWKLVKR